jgi:hypothetical protein
LWKTPEIAHKREFLMYNEFERAVVFAAYKGLEQKAKDPKGQCQLPPGIDYQVGGQTVTITLPEDTHVIREAGVLGNGLRPSTATQCTYSREVMFLFVERLMRFNQAENVMKELTEAMIEAVNLRCDDTASSLKQRNPQLYEKFDQWVIDTKKRLPLLPNDPTRRKCNFPKVAKIPVEITVNFHTVSKAA